MMISRLITLIAVLLIAVPAWSQPAEGQRKPGSLEELGSLPLFRSTVNKTALHATALKGRDQYRAMVNAGNFREFGLEKAEDAAATELGTPSKDYLVRLDKLKEFTRQKDPNSLLTNTGLVHYPLNINAKASSTVTMTLQRGAWKLISIGEAGRTLQRNAALQHSMKNLNRTEGEHFTVRIPALNVEFEAVRDANNVLQLTPTQDIPDWGLKTGVSEPAADIFLRLVPAAASHDGLPR